MPRDGSPYHEEPRRRNSAFLEIGLADDDAVVDAKLKKDLRPKLHVRFRSEVDIVEPESVRQDNTDPARKPVNLQMPFYFPTLPRLLFLALVIVLVIPSLHTTPGLQATANPVGARVGQSKDPKAVQGAKRRLIARHEKRDDTSVDVCKRWSHQSAVVNGTLYVYGGRSTTDSDQTADTWSMSLNPQRGRTLTICLQTTIS